MKTATLKIAVFIFALASLSVLARECHVKLRINSIHAKLDSIKVGMTEDEIVRIMGGPGHLEEVEKDSFGNPVAQNGQKLWKRSYTLMWYRRFFGIGHRAFFVVDVYFDKINRRVLDIQTILWTF